jgi:class 3 adenylate cyclase
VTVTAAHGETRYARHGDAHVAYEVLGADGTDLLALSFGVIPFQEMHDEPSLRRFHERLAVFSRVIRFDRPGVGASDPFGRSTPPSPEAWARAALDVLDAVGSTRATVLAPQESALEAIVLAATAPTRVERLVIVNGTARLSQAPDWPFGVPVAALDAVLASIKGANAENSEVDVLSMIAPSVADDPDFCEWWRRTSSRGAGPASALAIVAATFRADVRRFLTEVKVPTLVLHRTGDGVLVVDHGRRVSQSIAGARFVELDGNDHMYWVGKTDTLLGEIEEFVTGRQQNVRPNRALLTMLFVDIVDSTGRVATLGDERWRDALDRHDHAVRNQIDRFGGREVNRLGDGALAVFDLPSSAVRCALAIRGAARSNGLPVRAGLHTGEVELRGDDVAGMAVHIAARVGAVASSNQVLASGTTVDLMPDSNEQVTSTGHHALKGVPTAMELFEVC